MEVRDLRSLLAVLRHRSFTGAARELGYTQSAISQQVAALELEVGQQLVTRRPVRATPAGERLAAHAARVVTRLDVALSELRHLGATADHLDVVACPLAAPRVLARALRELRVAEASTPVTLTTCDAASALEALARGQADVALVDGITAPGEPLHLGEPGVLAAAPIAETKLAVAMAADHPLGRAESLDLETLTDAPWVLTPAFAGTARSALERAGASFLVEDHASRPRAGGLRLHAISGDGGGYRHGGGALASPPRPDGALTYDGSDLATLAALVAAGLGMALLPDSAAVGLSGVVTVPLRRPALVHRTEVLSLQTAAGRVTRLVQALRRHGGLGTP